MIDCKHFNSIKISKLQEFKQATIQKLITHIWSEWCMLHITVGSPVISCQLQQTRQTLTLHQFTNSTVLITSYKVSIQQHLNMCYTCAFSVCTQSLISYVLYVNRKILQNLFIGKITCLMHLTRKVHVKIEVTEMSDFSDFYAMLQYIFTHITMASGGNVNFQEYKVKCNDFKPLAASDTTESSLNLSLSEQFSNAISF